MSSFHPQIPQVVKIVYAQVKTNGKVELIPLKMYADGSLERNQ